MPKKQSFDAKCVTVYLKTQVNLWFIVEVQHDYLLLVSQDCDFIRFLLVCCTYEDNIASRYSDDESDQSNIKGINST